jgi:hypothetical protein
MHERETPNGDTGAATVPEALNKGVNFFATATLAILAISVMHTLDIAPNWISQLSNILFAVVAVAGVGWYLYGRNRYQRSYAPLAFLGLGLATQTLALASAGVVAGPNFGIAFFLAQAFIVITWQLGTVHRQARAEAS